MVLHELYASGKVSLIELVRNVPPQWTKLTAFLLKKKKKAECYKSIGIVTARLTCVEVR